MSGEPSPAAILVDANLPLWAHHRGFPEHRQAVAWWRETLSSCPFVGIPWPTVVAFLRISTHPRALERPARIGEAWDVVQGWLERSNVHCPVPTDRHADIIGRLALSANATGNHATDAHLAALAIEWGLELQSADGDFARYRELRWRNPLAAR